MVQLGVAGTDILLERRSMNTFQNAEFGEASALGIILFLVLAVFALIYMRMTSRLVPED